MLSRIFLRTNNRAARIELNKHKIIKQASSIYHFRLIANRVCLRRHRKTTAENGGEGGTQGLAVNSVITELLSHCIPQRNINNIIIISHIKLLFEIYTTRESLWLRFINRKENLSVQQKHVVFSYGLCMLFNPSSMINFNSSCLLLPASICD